MLSLKDLSVTFDLGKHTRLRAVQEVSLDLQAGETLGIVGESGCGKSTLARAILQLIPASGGAVFWHGQAVHAMRPAALKTFRRHVQLIFQDPLDALNPRMTVEETIAEPLRNLRPELGGTEIRRRVRDIISDVGLSSEQLQRYPHEFSGGQCQRIGIARAMIPQPELIICDEPVSALDVSIQAQIVNLLRDLRDTRRLSLLFISHDLSIVRHLSDRILVLYLGRIMELADADMLWRHPAHPYTQALLGAIPLADPVRERQRLSNLTSLASEPPSPHDPPAGCVFHPRCAKARDICKGEIPAERAIAPGHRVACHLAQSVPPSLP